MFCLGDDGFLFIVEATAFQLHLSGSAPDNVLVDPAVRVAWRSARTSSKQIATWVEYK